MLYKYKYDDYFNYYSDATVDATGDERGVQCPPSVVGQSVTAEYHTIRYDTRSYFNVRSKADISQLNLPHGTDN